MFRFLYVSSEVFKNRAELLILGLLLIALAVGIFFFINLLILIIRRVKKKKNSENKGKSKKNTLKSKLPYLITTSLSFLFLVGGASLIIYPYADYWNLDHKEFTLDSLSQHELESLGLSSANINSEIDTKEVASYEIRGKTVKFLSTPERSFNQNEINATLSVIEELPLKMLIKLPEKIEFVSYKDYEGYIAWAQGNRIYFSNITFNPNYPYREFEKTVIHELVHLTQYNSIPEEVMKKHTYNSSQINLEKDSDYLIEYAEKVGWERTDNGEGFVIDPKLELHQTSEYAKIGGPIEDMAETISLYYIGEIAVLSKGRVEWVRNNIVDDSITTYMIPRFKDYEWVASIPLSSSSYTAITPTWNLYTNNINTHFSKDLKTDKEVAGEKFMIKEYGFQHNPKPEKYDKVVEKWKKEMKISGWKLEKENSRTNKVGIKYAELIFSGPDERTKIIIEDRRSFTKESTIKELKESIAFNKRWGIDYSYYETRIEEVKEHEKKIKEQGVFVNIEHGKNIKTNF